MSLIDSFKQGHRNAQLSMAWLGQGTIQGQGLLGWSANIDALTKDLEPGGPDAECAISLDHGITEREAQRALLEHIGTSTKVDSNLIGEVVIDSSRLFFAPVYIFDCTSDTEWSAAFGYDRTEYFTEHRRVYEDGQYVVKPVTRANVLTDWHPQKGQDRRRFVHVAYAGAGLPASVAAWLEQVDFTGARSITNRQLSLMDTDPCAVDAIGVFGRLAEATGLPEVANGVYACLQGDRVRDCQWRTHIEGHYALALIPICHVTFTIHGQRYNFYVHGRDRSQWVCDPLPALKHKNRTVFKGYPAVYAVVAFLVMALTIGRDASPYWFPWVWICGGLFIYGCVREGQYTRRVASRRDDILKERLSELDHPANVGDRTATDVYSEEESPQDRFDARVIPAVLAVAMVFTIYLAHHAAEAPAPALVAGSVRPAPATSKQVPVPRAASTPAAPPVVAIQPDTSASVGILDSEVTDKIGFLTEEERARLLAKVRQLNEGDRHIFAILIVQSTAPETVGAYADRIANTVGLGSPGKSNGIFVVIAPGNSRDLQRIRISVGRDLTRQLSNDAVATILQQVLAPKFREHQYFAGLDDTIVALAEYIDHGQQTSAADAANATSPATDSMPRPDPSQQASFDAVPQQSPPRS
jgi:hypothetical protein